MSAVTLPAFSYLRSRIQARFGGDMKLWFPATRKAPTFTVEIACSAGPVSAKAATLMGFLSVPEDGLIIQATAADFPFEPRPGDVFIYGATAATGRKHEVITAARAVDYHSHYRIVSQRSGPGI